MIDLKNLGHFFIYLLLTCGCLFSNSTGTASSSSSTSSSSINSNTDNNNMESAEQYSETLSEQDNTQDIEKRPSFFVGSRYGRSGAMKSLAPLWATSTSLKSRRLNVMPRNDRFFLSSRYGKRHNNDYVEEVEKAPLVKAFYDDILPFTNYEQKVFPMQADNDATRIRGNNALTIMKCVYTGLTDYYRCNAVKTLMFPSGNYSFRNDNYPNDRTDINRI